MREPKLEPSAAEAAKNFTVSVKERAKRFDIRDLLEDKKLMQLAESAAERIFDGKKVNGDEALSFTKSLYGYSCVSLDTDDWVERTRQEMEKHNFDFGLTDFYAYLYARAMNSNTGANEKRDVGLLMEFFVKRLTVAKKDKEAAALVNPFGLVAGKEFFKHGKNGEPVKVVVDEVLVEGAGGAVICDGQDFDLVELNRRLAAGQFVLRDGASYLGDLRYWREKNSLGVFDCKKARATFTTPFGSTEGTIETITTNEKELEKEYGQAYLLFLPYLFKAKIKGNGVEKEVGVREMQFLSKWESLE